MLSDPVSLRRSEVREALTRAVQRLQQAYLGPEGDPDLGKPHEEDDDRRNQSQYVGVALIRLQR